MPRIRVKIYIHSGNQKGKLVQCLGKTGVMVNKILENKEVYFLIVDNGNMDKLLSTESRNVFAHGGFEVQYPPEYEASRTVILKNVDEMLQLMSVEELASDIDKDLKVRKVIKIPKNNRLLKIVFHSSSIADNVVEKGLKVHFQKFANKSIEKEIFIPLFPCYKCYEYSHSKRQCSKPEDYKIFSNCAREGHIFSDCMTKKFKCINCQGEHRTLAASCPKRKEIIRLKIREAKEKLKDRMDAPVMQTPQFQECKVPENYLAVMAATIVLAEKREIEVPGIYQYIVDEMLETNNIPNVMFPASVVRGYKEVNLEERNKAKRKRESTGADSMGRGGGGGGGGNTNTGRRFSFP